MSRVSAPDVETAVNAALANDGGDAEASGSPSADRDGFRERIDRIVVRPETLDISVRGASDEVSGIVSVAWALKTAGGVSPLAAVATVVTIGLLVAIGAASQ